MLLAADSSWAHSSKGRCVGKSQFGPLVKRQGTNQGCPREWCQHSSLCSGSFPLPSLWTSLIAFAGVLRPRQTLLEGDHRHNAHHRSRSSGGGAQRGHPPLRETLQRILRTASFDVCDAAHFFFHSKGAVLVVRDTSFRMIGLGGISFACA